MKFISNKGPFIRDKDSTHKIMNRVLLALTPIILFSFFKNGVLPFAKDKIGTLEALKPLLMILVSIIGSFVIEFIYYKFWVKKDRIIETLLKSYFIFPGLLLALILPLSTPLYLVFIGAIVANLFGKCFFGGFGHNLFNPALIGYVILVGAFGGILFSGNGYLNALEVDSVASATPLTKLDRIGHVGSYMEVTGDRLWQQFIGFAPGAIGEVSRLLIILALIYLIATKTIKWRIPIYYIGTVFFMTLFIGLNQEMNIWYPIFHVLSGGLLFGATFMATDPVTSPITKTGQIIYAIFIGIITVILRFVGPYAEGVATSILAGNMIVYVVDRIGVRANFNPRTRWISSVTVGLLIVGVSLLISLNLDNNPKQSAGFHIVSTVKKDDEIIYQVSQKSFHDQKIIADITFTKNVITSIILRECPDTYCYKMEEHNYTQYLITQQTNLNDVDTISGATTTSDNIKKIVQETIYYHMR